MLSAQTVKNSLRYLYRGAVHEFGYSENTVDALLENLNDLALAWALRQNLRRVYACILLDNGIMSPEFRGQDLFGQSAVRLYTNPLSSDEAGNADASALAGHFSRGRAWELWMKEDGNLAGVFSIGVHCGDGSHGMEYREICGYPFGSGSRLNLEAVTEELRRLCDNDPVLAFDSLPVP